MVMILKHIAPIFCRQSLSFTRDAIPFALWPIAVFLSSIAVALAIASLVQNGNDPEGQPEGNWAVLQQGSNTVYISGTPVGSPLQ